MLDKHRLDRAIEDYRQDILAAKGNRFKYHEATRKFWGRRYGYMGHETHLARLYPFNEHTVSSTHPWSSVIVGRTFGECDLKKFISLNDYLNAPSVMESILRGVVQGEMKLAEEIERQRQRELAKHQQSLPKLPQE